VRHDDKGCTARLALLNGAGQRRVALFVQARIGLVQHHEHRVAIQRTRQAHALALPARQTRALRPHRAVIALRQRQDELMQAHRARRRLHLGRLYLGKAGNVLGQRAFKQFHALRQITQVHAQLSLVPGVDVGAIEPHLTPLRGPQPDQQARQRGFTRRRRSHHRQHFAWRQRKLHTTQNQRRITGRSRDQLLDVQRATRCRQSHAARLRRHRLQKLLHTRPRIAHIHHRLPLRYHLNQWRQHTPAQNGRHNDHPAAATELVVQQEPSPQPQKHGAQRGLQQLGDGLKTARPLRRQRLQIQKIALLAQPPAVRIAQHAHRLDHLGIAQRVVGILLRLNGRTVGLHQRRLGTALIEPGHERLHYGKHQGRPAQHRADQEQQHHHDQRNGRLQQRQQHGRI